MNHNFLTIQAMTSIRYILAISILVLASAAKVEACGPYYPDSPKQIRMFRSCSPQLEEQWQEGCRFQDNEKYENCLLWQKLASPSIPLKDIEDVVYGSKLKDLKRLPDGPLSDNQFAQWLALPEHSEDLDYMLVAKEIEEIREYMNDPWYYPYDGDEEHARLDSLQIKCQNYKGRRHADRYALQLMRLYFAKKDFQNCIDLWESSVCDMPQNIVTDMMASYAGGSYYRKGNRDKAIELYTRSEDIGSLINLKAWDDAEAKSNYKDPRVKELEYIFNRFPNSPLLSVRLQQYIENRESFILNSEPDDIDDDSAFCAELKQFAKNTAASPACRQKGMWYYAIAYLYHLDGDNQSASSWLSSAERSEATPFIKESVKAFRFLLDATQASNSAQYRAKLLYDLKWLDLRMERDLRLDAGNYWQFSNSMNWPFYYWQDVARKVLLGEVCPRLNKAGNAVLAIQLANYASNRIVQLAPLYEAYHSGDEEASESYTVKISIDEFRAAWPEFNEFDYSNRFFDFINDVSAADAARYAETIASPQTELDKYLNERGYADTDYIYEIVGTLYLREMNYDKAVEWLSKVSNEYQKRTNIAKVGYFKLDPFDFQYDSKHYIDNSDDYKLRFAQEMANLEKMIASNAEPNRKAKAKIRFATGLRNSFGRCWYLTDYSYSCGTGRTIEDYEWHTSKEREGFRGNPFAQKAHKRVDALMSQALAEFTDPEQAAQAHLDMMNYKTVMEKYPSTYAASMIRGQCDNYYDYALHRK